MTVTVLAGKLDLATLEFGMREVPVPAPGHDEVLVEVAISVKVAIDQLTGSCSPDTVVIEEFITIKEPGLDAAHRLQGRREFALGTRTRRNQQEAGLCASQPHRSRLEIARWSDPATSSTDAKSTRASL
ncbi:hypothetical protein [Lentzea sp. CC55]|uniref:hypothetical protein n=1 Tax=Lentzea sp. CC55 TaxID=2884909 RepID=UPI001F1C0588|nr:hypothetical protein [Lentzea sp. CC55]MCG8923228.1 hypothetical protein [Lentzea sp. CC55]